MLAGEQPCHTRVWRRFHGELTQSDKSHSRAPEMRKRSWLEIESGGALVQSRINTYLLTRSTYLRALPRKEKRKRS